VYSNPDYSPRLLAENGLSDIAVLADLRSLAHLDLARNAVGDLSALFDLPDLRWLAISGNPIREAAQLENLTNLATLLAADCGIRDADFVSGLPRLVYLDLSDNLLTDLEPLVTHTWPQAEEEWLLSQVTIKLEGNPLDLAEGSPAKQQLQLLQDRGIKITY